MSHRHTRELVEAVKRLWAQRWPNLLCAIPLVFLAIQICAAQTFDYSKQAEFDEKGNIFVSSDDGKLIWMTDLRHCSEATVAEDGQTVGCRVAGPLQTPPFQLEMPLKKRLQAGHCDRDKVTATLVSL